ncbi:MAG: ethanolamine ammonia-lyase subunit EutC [Betaproteobacteria bacterium]
MSDLIEDDGWASLRRFTPARIALGRAGHSVPTAELLRFGLAHARARDAVHLAYEPALLIDRLEQLDTRSVVVHSAASDRGQYLRRPDLGRRLREDSATELAAYRQHPPPQLCLVVGDVLSAQAIHRHALPMLELLIPAFVEHGLTLGPVVIAQQSRVALADEIGERPGLSSPDSLGIYLTYDPHVGRVDSERNCISNVRPEGLAFKRAANQATFLVREALRLKLSGVKLKDDSQTRAIDAQLAIRRIGS